ncbi:hypothetical protein ARMA_1537 [Ardenticatena maritima]|uniref:Uncharacterized protein n=1 Tax=Ardenticatena maritima TaxID=872965 RepID=A0A0M9UCM8_9CHLR|nr:hypothetical protein ARMA_1537 [Ardenticatena maritima]
MFLVGEEHATKPQPTTKIPTALVGILCCAHLCPPGFLLHAPQGAFRVWGQ